ncbi:response regulator receiver modulated diguanylate cyclase/phosphodiesterase [Rippkaea orientalis PCC 8801]|uniref:Response regulator receiver modulated diguanylate cyclase/phosphodiesterase n=2 Tax=Rippkaea TaxID=2546365 RepID=B7JYQ8_RIPO1|nr:response regulator receiver modulated diguanylate cyclase/phosphodiesterase [Rippkaea orientalis PCC 8801]
MVQDSPDDAQRVLCELKTRSYSAIYHQHAKTAAQMLQALNISQPWDVVLIDYDLPQLEVSNILEVLQEQETELPFIVVSQTLSEQIALKALKAGAHDYLEKSNLDGLILAIEQALKEAELKKQYQKIQEKIKYCASYDESTGLPNRNFFIEHLGSLLENQQLSNTEKFAILLVHLNRFQMVKYGLGVELSEQLSIAMAERLKKYVKFPDILARMRSDEFVILLKDLEDAQEAHDLADKLQNVLAQPFHLDGSVIYSPGSIGIVHSHSCHHQTDEYLRAADIATHYAQLKNRGGSVIYNDSMRKQVRERLELETDLQDAIYNKQLYLNYQPIVSLETNQITGFEALVRWKHPKRGLLSPTEFIPLAEETGLIIPLGQWAMMEACSQLRSWQQKFPQLSAISINVNLSGIQLGNPDLINQIDDLLDSVGLTGESLKLEITESFLMENLMDNSSIANKMLEQLKERKIKLCIDDFGTGYSSLSYLHHLPIDILKIDRSFINPKTNGRKNSDIVKSIVNLAQDLGLALVAEGVETPSQLAMLKELKCDYGQGYLFARPLEASQAMEFMSHQFN